MKKLEKKIPMSLRINRIYNEKLIENWNFLERISYTTEDNDFWYFVLSITFRNQSEHRWTGNGSDERSCRRFWWRPDRGSRRHGLCPRHRPDHGYRENTNYGLCHQSSKVTAAPISPNQSAFNLRPRLHLHHPHPTTSTEIFLDLLTNDSDGKSRLGSSQPIPIDAGRKDGMPSGQNHR